MDPIETLGEKNTIGIEILMSLSENKIQELSGSFQIKKETRPFFLETMSNSRNPDGHISTIPFHKEYLNERIYTVVPLFLFCGQRVSMKRKFSGILIGFFVLIFLFLCAGVWDASNQLLFPIGNGAVKDFSVCEEAKIKVWGDRCGNLRLTMFRGKFDGLLSPLHSLRLVKRIPIFLIHSKEDNVVPYSRSQELANVYRGPKDLWLADKGNHGTIRGADPIEYENRLRNFLLRKRFSFRGDF
ncbi:alpha/beta hydrolase [Leptospira adleri]|uniref:alpha/beta hydrolase n=1 Tax=Leptospira adleri TaxID=2023186 RepID=UPI001FD42220|nr:alpha/beta hydrolase [Leptospira adleri]